MSRSVAAAAQRPSESGSDVAAVADNVVRLLRTFQKTRTRLLAAAEHDVEWSAHILLRCIANEGPVRASAVADLLHSDPSTVSRQVAALVRDGLLERRPDPLDGRASLLFLTAEADEVLAHHEHVRHEFFARMLDEWDADDLHDFARLLDRFTDTYESSDNTWISERIARPRSTN